MNVDYCPACGEILQDGDRLPFDGYVCEEHGDFIITVTEL